MKLAQLVWTALVFSWVGSIEAQTPVLLIDESDFVANTGFPEEFGHLAVTDDGEWTFYGDLPNPVWANDENPAGIPDVDPDNTYSPLRHPDCRR